MEAIYNNWLYKFIAGPLYDIAWLYILLPCVFVGGLYFTVRSGFVQIRHFGHAMKNTVGKMFQKKLGMSPQKYITKLKMDAARQMLENDGSLRVKEVAVRLGFSSLAYFCNVYRQYWGRSPRD